VNITWTAPEIDRDHLRRIYRDRVRDGREIMNAVRCERCGRFTWQHRGIDFDAIISDGAKKLADAIDAQALKAAFVEPQ